MIELKKLAIVVIFIIISILILFYGYQSLPKEEFSTLLNNINSNREIFQKKSPPKVNEYVDYLNIGDEGFKDEELNSMIPYLSNETFNSELVLTKQEALEDVDTLFKLFKYAYAGYGYFGGDKVFNKAKQEIIMEISKLDSVVNDNLVKLLKSKLSFIKDGHFSIGDIEELNIYYSYPNEYFLKDKKGFYKIIDNEKHYIKLIDSSENFDNFMKLTINNEGKLVYTIGVTKISKISIDKKANNYNIINDELPIEISYGNKERVYTDTAILRAEKLIQYEKKDSFTLETENNIPVVTFNKVDSNVKFKQISDVVDGLKDKNVTVVDVRGNMGGDSKAGDFFCEKMGIPGIVKFNTAKLLSKPILFQEQYLQNNQWSGANISINKYIKNEFNNEMSLADNNQLIIVLIDRNVASSGEWIIRRLCTMKNIVLIGTNSRGANLLRNNYPYKLPNSNIRLSLGAELLLCVDIDRFELNGFTPDIWVNSNESLDKVIKLISYYGLNNN